MCEGVSNYQSTQSECGLGSSRKVLRADLQKMSENVQAGYFSIVDILWFIASTVDCYTHIFSYFSSDNIHIQISSLYQ